MVCESGDTLIVYNSSTGAVLRFSDPVYINKIKQYMTDVKVEILPDTKSDQLIEVLLKKRVLVDEETNELDMCSYVYNTHITRNTVLELTLVITRQCNYRCVYCYEDHLNLSMSDEVYHGLLTYIDNSYAAGMYSGVSISLFGGEPLLDYDKMICFLKDVHSISQKRGRTFSAGITTNGSLLFPQRFEELLSVNCTHFQITMDGLKKTHDKYRVAIDGHGWDTLNDNLRYMASTNKRFDVTLRTNFNEEILNHANEFYKYVKDNFDSRFSIYYEGIKHLGGINDDKVSVMDHVSAGISMVDISLILKRHSLHNDVCSTRLLPFSHVCQATKYNSFVVDYDGTLLKCTLDFNDERNKVGYITSDGNMIINHQKHYKWLTVGFENNKNCQVCKLLPLCYGRRCVSGCLESKKIECNPEVEQLFLMEQIKNNFG